MRCRAGLETGFGKVDNDDVAAMISLDHDGRGWVKRKARLAPPIRRGRLYSHARSNSHYVTPYFHIALLG